MNTTAVGIKLAYIFYSPGTSLGVTIIELEAVAMYSTTVKMAAWRAFCQKPWQKRMNPNWARPKAEK